MLLMYVDESGDCGLVNSPTRYYVLSGLVVHELRWQTVLAQLADLRRSLRLAFGLRLREEFHAAALINRPGDLVRIRRHDRLAMIRIFAAALAAVPDVSIINVVVDKSRKPPGYDVFGMAWKVLIQRLENTVGGHNFRGPANPDERSMVFCDHTDDKKLMHLMRPMRSYNPVPHKPGLGGGYRNLRLQYVIEDPSFRSSLHSYFIQAADLVTFLLYQHLAPSAYIRKKSGQNLFKGLKPVLCTTASESDPEGVVRL